MIRIVKLGAVALVLFLAWLWADGVLFGDDSSTEDAVAAGVCEGIDVDGDECKERLSAVETVCATLEEHEDKTAVAADLYTAARKAAIRQLGGDETDTTSGLGELLVNAAVTHACPDLRPEDAATDTG